MTGIEEKTRHAFELLKKNQRSLWPVSFRKECLRKLLKAINNSEEDIMKALKDDMRKNAFDAYVAEIAPIKQEIVHALKNVARWAESTRVKTELAFWPGTSWVTPSPKGVVLIIAPWNYPIQLSLIPLVSAIASGNVAIIKPSELAASSAKLIYRIVHETLPSECFQVINGEAQTAEALLMLPFDHIFYTGSTKIGKAVMKAAAEHLSPVTLELGGKSPCLIDKSANLKLAAKRIAWGKCLNAGQTCIAPDYVLIEHSIKQNFLALLKDALKSMYGDDPFVSDDYGRIINLPHWSRLNNYLSQGKIAFGGRHMQSDLYIEPTVLVSVDEHSPVMEEEIFGPILPVIPVADMRHAINFVNHRPYPLALYLFSMRDTIINAVKQECKYGGMSINDTISHIANLNLPFGGRGPSGIGNYHGHYGFKTFSHESALYQRSNFLDNPIKYPPHNRRKVSVAKLLV